jgi:hypothetical protein
MTGEAVTLQHVIGPTDLVEIHNLGRTHYLMADGRRIPPDCCDRKRCLTNVVYSQVPERAKIDADPPAGRPKRLSIVLSGTGLDRGEVADGRPNGAGAVGKTPPADGPRPDAVVEASLEKPPRSDSTIPRDRAVFQKKADGFSSLEAAAQRAEESGRDVEHANHPLVNPRAPAGRAATPAKPQQVEGRGIGHLPSADEVSPRDLSTTMDDWFGGKTAPADGAAPTAEPTAPPIEAAATATPAAEEVSDPPPPATEKPKGGRRRQTTTQPHRTDRRSRAAREAGAA